MSAHLSQLHAPRWLREVARAGSRGHRYVVSRGRRPHGSHFLPVALVAALSLCAGAVHVIDRAAPPSRVASNVLDLPVPMERAPQVLPTSLVDIPPASADATSL
jgi:hypothetical protein